jgi:hypothetical protein
MGAAAAAALLSPLSATSALAQAYGYGWRGGYDDHVRHEIRECRHELREADSRWDYERARRECHREIWRARRESWREHHRWRHHRDWDDHRDWRDHDRYDRDRYGYRRW